MGEQTLVDAIMQTRARIDFIWQFFVTVHLAVFALVLIYDQAVETMNLVARTFALAGIAVFEWINGNALIGAYDLADALHQQFRADFGQAKYFQPAFIEHFVMTRLDGQEKMIMMTHGGALLFLVMAFMWRRFIQARRREA